MTVFIGHEADLTPNPVPHDAQTKHLVASLDASVRAMQDLLDGLLARVRRRWTGT